MKKASLSYDQAKMLAPITRAYLQNDPDVRHLYDWESTPENVLRIIEQRQNTHSIPREELAREIESQYTGCETSSLVIRNIEKLNESNTFTVTTGHQLNIFTGPLYFIYKIISAIAAAKELNLQYPQYHFVPVYWMATEDADFEEINHTFVQGEKIEWNSLQTGMVGEFSTSDMGEALYALEELLGKKVGMEHLASLFIRAYQTHRNLADATRYLVNALFQEYGLVIVDGNSSELKRHFAPIVLEELTSQSSYRLVSETISTFPEGMVAQVNPREINLFYTRPGIRERIVATDSGFEVNGTDISFTREEIEKELDRHPERFSPNVILRPVYQELVLPNVMYFGGGAELAYWLELKSTFQHHQVSFPLLQIRNSFLILDGNAVKKILQCCLSIEQMFLPENEQVQLLLQGDNPFKETLLTHKQEVDEKIKGLILEIEQFDASLIPSLKSTKAGFLKELKKLDQKIMKSVKRKNEVKLNRLATIRQVMFPGNTFQERKVNVLDMFQTYGASFLDTILEHTEPFTRKMFILYPDDMTLKRD
jgi:bacillithiol biosynthesis cysteine-adding enzyme BshC